MLRVFLLLLGLCACGPARRPSVELPPESAWRASALPAAGDPTPTHVLAHRVGPKQWMASGLKAPPVVVGASLGFTVGGAEWLVHCRPAYVPRGVCDLNRVPDEFSAPLVFGEGGEDGHVWLGGASWTVRLAQEGMLIDKAGTLVGHASADGVRVLVGASAEDEGHVQVLARAATLMETLRSQEAAAEASDEVQAIRLAASRAHTKANAYQFHPQQGAPVTDRAVSDNRDVVIDHPDRLPGFAHRCFDCRFTYCAATGATQASGVLWRWPDDRLTRAEISWRGAGAEVLRQVLKPEAAQRGGLQAEAGMRADKAVDAVVVKVRTQASRGAPLGWSRSWAWHLPVEESCE